jgi:hypothetical protein
MEEEEIYRSELNTKQQKEIVEYFRNIAHQYHEYGKKGQGMLLDDEGRPFVFVGSSYVRVEGDGSLQDLLIGDIERILNPTPDLTEQKQDAKAPKRKKIDRDKERGQARLEI